MVKPYTYIARPREVHVKNSDHRSRRVFSSKRETDLKLRHEDKTSL